MNNDKTRSIPALHFQILLENCYIHRGTDLVTQCVQHKSMFVAANKYLKQTLHLYLQRLASLEEIVLMRILLQQSLWIMEAALTHSNLSCCSQSLEPIEVQKF